MAASGLGALGDGFSDGCAMSCQSRNCTNFSHDAINENIKKKNIFAKMSRGDDEEMAFPAVDFSSALF